MMNNIQLWSKLIDESPKGSTLMGGAIVDPILFKKPKDYDIWYNYNKQATKFIAPPNWKYIEAIGKNLAEIIEMYGVEEAAQSDIVRIENYNVTYNGEEHLVQLIGLTIDPKEHFKTFDHSLTLGAFSKAGLFIDNRVFKSIQTKTVTLLNKSKPEKSLLRAQAKVAKLDPAGALDWHYEGWDD